MEKEEGTQLCLTYHWRESPVVVVIVIVIIIFILHLRLGASFIAYN